MTAFVRFGTRFSVSTASPAKVAKPAKVEGGEEALSQLSQVSREAISETEYPSPPAALVLPATRIAATIAEGAEREDDPDGWLVLVLPDGRRHIVAPHMVAALDAAGLLAALPASLPRSSYAARARPPSWSDEKDAPREGDRCCRCRSGRWWTAAPISGGWRCSTCHPPPPGLTIATTKTKEPVAG